MSNDEQNNANEGQSRLTAVLDRKIYDAAAWFCDNPNCSDIEDALRELVAEAVSMENEACAKVCELISQSHTAGGMSLYVAREFIYAADEIRKRSNVQGKGLATTDSDKGDEA